MEMSVPLNNFGNEIDVDNFTGNNEEIKVNQNKALEAEFVKFFDEKGGCIYENAMIDFLQTDLGLKRSDYEKDLNLFFINNCYKIANTYFIKSLNDSILDPVKALLI